MLYYHLCNSLWEETPLAAMYYVCSCHVFQSPHHLAWGSGVLSPGLYFRIPSPPLAEKRSSVCNSISHYQPLPREATSELLPDAGGPSH